MPDEVLGTHSIGELEIELKQRDARIIELTEERDKEQKLNEESRDNSDRWDAAFDAWKKRLGLLSGSLP